MWLFCLLDPGQIRYRAIYTHPNQIPGYASGCQMMLVCTLSDDRLGFDSHTCSLLLYLSKCDPLPHQRHAPDFSEVGCFREKLLYATWPLTSSVTAVNTKPVKFSICAIRRKVARLNRVRAVVKEHVHAKFHRAKCSGSRVIVRTERKKTRTNIIQSVATAPTVIIADDIAETTLIFSWYFSTTLVTAIFYGTSEPRRML